LAICWILGAGVPNFMNSATQQKSINPVSYAFPSPGQTSDGWNAMNQKTA